MLSEIKKIFSQFCGLCIKNKKWDLILNSTLSFLEKKKLKNLSFLLIIVYLVIFLYFNLNIINY